MNGVVASVFAAGPSPELSPVVAAPVVSRRAARAPGTRSRAGNAMGRTRTAVLEGAARSIEKYGTRRTTMADIAALAGVAKATVYNHFRTKPEVYAALVVAEVEHVAAECRPAGGPNGLADALAQAADRIGSHPVARRLAVDEPALLAKLVMPSNGAGWQAGRAAVESALAVTARGCEPAAVDLVLRWLSSQLTWPAGAEELALGAALLARGLPREPEPGSPATPAEAPNPAAP